MSFLLQVENVKLLDRVSPRRSRVGTLYLTATHTIFVENEAGVRNETWVGTSYQIRHALHSVAHDMLLCLDSVVTVCTHASCCALCLQHTIKDPCLPSISNQVLHSLVCSVEKQAATASGCSLLIHCKNFQVLHFVLPQERECQDVHLSLQRLSQPGNLLRSVW